MLRRHWLMTCLLLGAAASNAWATHTGTWLDVFFIRPDMANEGYLNYQHVAGSGEERTGWTDIRHPAYDGADYLMTHTKAGYDRSDFWVEVKNSVATIDPTEGPGVAMPNIPGDYNYANAAWAQAGLSIVSVGVDQVDFTTGNPPVSAHVRVNDPVNFDELWRMFSTNRPGGNTIQAYYASSGRTENDGSLSGTTRRQEHNEDANGIMVFDNAGNDTFAHELGHYLLGPYKWSDGTPNEAGGKQGHSSSDTDLMAAGNLPRQIPGVAPKDPTFPSAHLKDGHAPRDVGRHIGSIGSLSNVVAGEQVRLNNDPANPWISQVAAVHYSNTIHREDNASYAGDRADFDWVEDNRDLELAGNPNADNHPGSDDWMVWNIGEIQASPHETGMVDHDHGDWGELDRLAFAGEKFNTVDVFSQVARYTDMDTVPGGASWSRRESALDYDTPEFLVDGKWAAGSLLNVFKPGWTTRSWADDYVARWGSPGEATAVRIKADDHGLHDGNTQIDAVIAATDTYVPWVPKRFKSPLTNPTVDIGQPVVFETSIGTDPTPREQTMVRITSAEAYGGQGPTSQQFAGNDKSAGAEITDEIPLEIVALDLTGGEPIDIMGFGVQVEHRDSQGQPGTFTSAYPFDVHVSASSFNVTYEIETSELQRRQRFLMTVELLPALTTILVFAPYVDVMPGISREGESMAPGSLTLPDSFFDVYFDIIVTDPQAFAQLSGGDVALFNMNLGGAIVVPEPTAFGPLLLIAMLLRRRTR